MIWFTSDPHYNHTNIIKYCNRPFKTVEEMNETMIRNWNQKVEPEDDVFLLGDICMGIPHQWAGFVNQLNGNIHLILGNHDNKKYYRYMNKIVAIDEYKMIRIGDDNIMLHHYPPFHTQNKIPKNMEPDLYLCGHVHEAWRFNEFHNIPVYNVGVDVNNFSPVCLPDIWRRIGAWRKNNGNR